MASLRLSANHGGNSAAGLHDQPQTGAADDARGQPAVRPAAQLRGYDELASQSAHLPEPGRPVHACRINQLWVADITYIRLRVEFVYLAVVLDAYSRRVIGWALGRRLVAELTVTALRMALVKRKPSPGWVHHSDRGVQYAAQEYTDVLKEHGAEISMSRKGNPYDNAACESFMKTLKYEEVYRNEYRDFHEARARIDEFIGDVYNQRRLHSALGYVPPAEFEQNGGATP